MNFGQSIEALRAGKKVKRSSWGNSYLYFVAEGSEAALAEVDGGKYAAILPHVFFKAEGSEAVNFAITAEDGIANDWVEVSEA